ncbi:hypothetical protein AAC387_Pa11g0370 [Persea americana]
MGPLEKFDGLEMLANQCISILEGKVSLPCLKEEKEKESTSLEIAKKKIKKEYNNMPYKKIKLIKSPEDQPLPGWLEAHLRMSPYRTPKFILHFHKGLTFSDVKHNLNRLLIPKEVAHETLIPGLGYNDIVKAEKGPLSEGIKLVGLDRMGRKWNLELKWWSSSGAHNLIGEWMKLVKCNGLKAKIHTVDVSVFKYGESEDQICFLILHSDNEENKEKKSSPTCQIEEVEEDVAQTFFTVLDSARLLTSSSPMAFYDSTPMMCCSSEVHLTVQELLQLRQIPHRIPDVILEDGDYHLLSCSFEKPCFFCDDKYSTSDPVYCYGVLMGGIRQGKPRIPMSDYKVSCEQEHHNKKLLSREFSRIQEDDANDDHHDILSCSYENPSLVCYHKDSSSCPQPRILEKASTSVAHLFPLILY